MIHLLFTLLMVEVALSLGLVFRNPIRDLLVTGLDKMKTGRRPLMANSVGGTLFVVFVSNLLSAMKIQKRSMESGSVNPTDQVLMANHLLEAYLLGFCLFLGLMINRLHYLVKELYPPRISLEEVKGKQSAKHTTKEPNPTRRKP